MRLILLVILYVFDFIDIFACRFLRCPIKGGITGESTKHGGKRKAQAWPLPAAP